MGSCLRHVSLANRLRVAERPSHLPLGDRTSCTTLSHFRCPAITCRHATPARVSTHSSSKAAVKSKRTAWEALPLACALNLCEREAGRERRVGRSGSPSE